MARRLLALVGLLAIVGGVAFAYEASDADRTALDDALDTWLAAYNDHDSQALAMEYTEDADILFVTGEKVKGRKAVGEAFAEYFKANPKVQTKLTEIERTFLAADVVIEDGVWEDTGLTDRNQPTKGLYTSVLVKRDGKWLVVHERAWEHPTK